MQNKLAASRTVARSGKFHRRMGERLGPGSRRRHPRLAGGRSLFCGVYGLPEIIITEFMDEAAVGALAHTRNVLYDPQLVDKPGALHAALADARALIVRNRTQVRPDLLAHAPNLTCVGRLGVGLDNIDLPECAARSIAVFPATGANDVAVAEYVIATAMMLLRGAYGATPAVALGKWPRNALIGRELSGKTLGLVGFGAIARETALRARVMGMDILAHDPFVPAAHPSFARHDAAKVPLDEVFRRADVISLHVPLTEATRNLINAQSLALMRPGAVLINAARGGIVDQAALALALRAEKLGGAALDVFDAEPLDAANGGVFADCPNLILTPHIAGVTQESNVRVSSLIARLVAGHLADRP